MTPDQWGQVKVIFGEAMDLAAEDRAAFIAHACGEDSALRQEVQVLVDKAGSTVTFVENDRRERILPKARSYVPLLAAGEVLSGRYKVIRFIAKGGMGEVYEVGDGELRTKVALKTVSLAIASNPHQMDRFKREVNLARQVTHVNVCRVFDVGHHKHPDHGDITFLTMELLHGETLAARLERGGPLTCEQALSLIHQMVLGLSAAHDLGIIHRDFKPGNVMLLEGTSATHLKVTDFGLARSLDSDETLVTRHGEVVGTPDFMAPEQFSGQSSVETDVYALGLVIYVMLAAKLPASRATPFAEGKESVAGAGTQVDPRWRPTIERCLAANPNDRFHSVQEVWGRLSGNDPDKPTGLAAIGGVVKRYRLILASLLVLVVGYCALAWRDIAPNPFRRLPEQKHIAVLPFQNIGNDVANQAFTDGVVESLTSKLSQLERFQKSFWIVPSSDARKVTGLDDAYRNLNITLAVTGSIQHVENGVVLTANLVDAKNHKQLASRTIRAKSGNLDRLQDQVWESVADMVDLQVSREVAQIVNSGGTMQPGAYEMYEQGMGYLQRLDHQNIDNAISVFTKAIDKDPNYALAYAGLGQAYSHEYALTKDPQSIRKAVWNGRRAVELDNSSAPAHVALGEVYVKTGQLDAALSELHLALQQDPAAVDAEYHIGEVYEAQGKFDEAEAAHTSVVNRRPGYPAGYSGLGTFYYRHGQFQKAADQFQTMIDLQPDNFLAYEDLAGAYIAMARYEDAINVLKNELSHKQTSSAWTNLGAAYIYLKRYPEAVDAMKKATEVDPHNNILWRNLGDSYRLMPSRDADAALAYQKALLTATDELSVNPNNTEVLSGIALYHAHLGQKKDAEVFITKALKLDPTNSDVLFTSALVYEIIGHRDRALKAIEEAFDAGYSLADIEGEPELAKLRSDVRYERWVQSKKNTSGLTRNIDSLEAHYES